MAPTEQTFRLAFGLRVITHRIDQLGEPAPSREHEPDLSAPGEQSVRLGQVKALRQRLHRRTYPQQHRFGLGRLTVDKVVDIVRSTQGFREPHQPIGEGRANLCCDNQW